MCYYNCIIFLFRMFNNKYNNIKSIKVKIKKIIKIENQENILKIQVVV